MVWSWFQSPERAKADPWTVWISVLKGFSGNVYYLGTREEYAYVQIGDMFPEYYKTPACNTSLPRSFDLGAGKPYRMVLDNIHGYWSTRNCKEIQTTAPSEIARPAGGT